MSPQATAKLASLRASKNYLSIAPIRMRDVAEIQRNGTVRMRFPHTAVPVVFQTDEIEMLPDGTYEWYGKVAGDPGSYAFIKNEGEGPYGFSIVDGKSYQIQSINNQHLLLQSNDAEFFGRTCGVIDGLTGGLHDQSERKFRTSDKDHCDEPAVIRILTLYTDAADLVVANMSQKVGALIGQANIAAINSDLDAHDIRFEGAGVLRLADFDESNDIQDDLFDLRDQGETVGGFIDNLRNDLGADVVVLLTDGNYANAAGIAFEGPGFENRAYGIVEVDFPEARHSYIHEIGHMLGARHDDNEGPVGTNPFFVNVGDFAAGRVFFDGLNNQNRWTIMAVGPTNNTRIPHFSNPDVDFNNIATGTATRDNARQIEENGACLVAQYRPPFVEPVEVIITGFTSIDAGQTATWCTNIFNCDNVTNFNWSFSYDGFNYTSFFGGSCASRTAPASGVSTMWLRVTVTCANGTNDTDTHRVSIIQGNSGGGQQPRAVHNYDPRVTVNPLNEEIIDLDDEGYAIPDLRVYPNPVRGERTVNYQLPIQTGHQQSIAAKLYTIDGKLLQTLKLSTSDQSGQINLGNDLQSGLYLIRFMVDDAHFATKIAVR